MKKTKKAINRKYHLFDAEGKILGRFTTEIVKVLRGKHKADFSPHIDGGDFVVIINSDKVRFTGEKATGKIYHSFSGYPGGITSINLREQIKKDSRKIFQYAAYGMLPKNKLRNRMMTRLLIFKDSSHNKKIDIIH